MTRVLYFVQNFAPRIGGVETVSADLVTALAERGHDVTVLTSRDDDALAPMEDVGGIMVRRIDLHDAVLEQDLDRVVAARRELARAVEETRPQIVHAVFSPLTAFYAPRMLRGHDVPLVLAFHGIWPGVTGHPDGLAAHVLRRAAWTTACSQAVLEDVRSFAAWVSPRSGVVPNGLESPRKSKPPPAGRPAVLAAGRLSPEKGFDVLLDAIGTIRDHVPGLRVRIAGDGPARAALEAHAGALGLGDVVEFVGWRSRREVGSDMEEATVVAVPSRTEGFGLVALEAALRARAVVASRVGGLPEVVGGPDTGVLVDAEDPQALADALVAVLSRPERAAGMGAAARARAAARYPARRPVDAYAVLYSALLHEAA